MKVSELHLPTLDLFTHYGKLSATYIPVLHYFYGLEGVVLILTTTPKEARRGRPVIRTVAPHGLYDGSGAMRWPTLCLADEEK